jgi:hypothetical protein
MGCADLFLDKPGSGGEAGSSGDMPEGYGAVSIRLTSGAARTAAPENVLDNLCLSYVFTRLVEEGSRPGMLVPDGPGEEMTPDEDGIVVLEAGRYRLTVKAYTDAAREDLVAEGAPEKDFDINAGGKVAVEVYLRPAASGGTGELAFTLKYPAGAAVETLTLTLMPDGEIIDLLTEATELTPSATGSSGTKNGIAAGYYLLQVVVVNSEGAAGRTEVAHIYQGRTTEVAYSFGSEDFQAYYVTSAADVGPGTLRWAIKNALALGKGKVELLLEPGTVVELETPLAITGDLEIEGNGVILTRGKDWTGEYGQLLRIKDKNVEATVRRVHFKDGQATEEGGAVHNEGKLTLESCIFSGNQTNANGGAVWNNGDLTIRGCTFYENSAQNGGAVCSDGTGSVLTLTGNLFYGNKATDNNPVVRRDGTVTDKYNVVDVELGTGAKQAGLTSDPTNQNEKVDGLTVSPKTFRVLYQSGAAGKVELGVVKENYPTVDFYGNSIAETGMGAAGAVQESTVDGWYLGLSVKDDTKGSVTTNNDVNGDGVVPLETDITPAPGTGQALGYWTVNGVKMGAGADPKSMKITKHSVVEAVFGRRVEVSNEADLSGALDPTKAKDDDVIVLSGGEIVLDTPLSYAITKNVVIEGNGATLTTKSDWSPGANTQLLRITDANAEVLIRRVHFKDGSATNQGGAIYNEGSLILESCIFSGNQTGSSDQGNGGAVNSFHNDLTIRGCTFYKNAARVGGGAVYFNGSGGKTLTLTGNVFSGNSLTSTNKDNLVVSTYSGTTNASYNVVDAATGTGNDKAGWDFATTDKNIDPLPGGLPVSPKTFRVLNGNVAATNLPTPLPEGYPTEDFYGKPIVANGAAGAVQGSTANPLYLELSINDENMGTADASSSIDYENGTISAGGANVQPMPNTGYALAYMMVNGVKSYAESVNITDHTWLEVVFGVKAEATSEGLSSALAAAGDGDVIVVSGVEPGKTSITLTSDTLAITKSVTIEGNGVVLESDYGYAYKRQVSIGAGAEVTIRGVQFAGGNRPDGAVENKGKLTLESCIFDGNYGSGETIGGAVWSSGDLIIRGCTFYNNYAEGGGRAVHFEGNSLTLTGNLFYYAKADSKGTPMVSFNGSVTSSYNAANKEFGTGNDQTGFTGNDNKKITSAPFTISDPMTSFKPDTADLNIVPANVADFPATDFSGKVRKLTGDKYTAGAVTYE